jgi:periplasmic divalent cation tolerance protein
MSELVMAFTTLPADFDATTLAQDLVAAGLAACVNVLPAVTSVYTWEGVPQVDKEQQLIIKTTHEAVDALWEVLRTRHPYDTPEFVVVPIIDGSEDYLAWVEKSVGPSKES